MEIDSSVEIEENLFSYKWQFKTKELPLEHRHNKILVALQAQVLHQDSTLVSLVLDQF